MAKVVYNTCYGGFSLSQLAADLLAKRKNWNESDTRPELSRHDHDLVAVVEALGEAANGDYARLAVVEWEDGAPYRIDEYDGSERVMGPLDYNWQTAE